MRARLQEAIALLRNDDPEQTGRALALLQSTVFAFSMKVCGHHEDAEDTMQEVLLRSVPHLRKITDPRAMAVWLYKVTRNRCWRSRRKPSLAPSVTLSLDELMPDHDELQQLLQDRAPSPEQQVADGQQARLLHEAVLQLPPMYRIVLVLHDMEELDTDVVAGILDLQPGTVRVRLHRARLALRRIVAQQASAPAASGPADHKTGSDRKTEAEKKPKRDPKCCAIFANLTEYLDGRLPAPACEEIKAHMEACPPCMAFLNDLSAAIDRCRTFQDPEQQQVQMRLGSLLAAEYTRMAAQSAAIGRAN